MSTKEKSKDRKKPVLVGWIVLLVILGVGGWYGYNWLRNTITFVATDDASVDGNHVNVSAKTLGRIKSLFVEEGADVTEGQLLIQLDDTDLHAQETQAIASLNYAQQNVKLSKVNLDKTQEDFQRSKTLFNAGAQTKEQYSHAQKALDTANAQYSIAAAQVETARAQLGVIEAQLQNTKITAPISGVISKKAYQQGDVIQPGQSIFTINDLSTMWVTANFEETKIRRIKLDAEVEITVDAYPNHSFKGKVVRIGAGTLAPAFTIGDFTKTTQRIPIKIMFDSIPQGVTLVPGMSVEVKVKI